MRDRLTFAILFRRLSIGILILILTLLVCAMIGSKSISLSEVVSFFTDSQADSINKDIFFKIRLPRVWLAALVGAALGCSGAVLQALLRNPLADPYILGISSGAGLGAVLATVAGLSISFLGKGPIAISAFAGAFATVWIVWGIGSLTGKHNLTGLLLAGVVVNSFFSAIIMFMISIAQSQEIQTTLVWLMGNISEESPSILTGYSIVLLLALSMLFRMSSKLNLLSFSHNDAKSIGINPSRERFIAFTLTAIITAVAVSMSGLVGFVGLIVPHAVRLVAGPDHRQLLPLSTITGAIFLVITDTVARTVIAPAQLPVGIITALLGGPFFIILMVKSARKLGVVSK